MDEYRYHFKNPPVFRSLIPVHLFDQSSSDQVQKNQFRVVQLWPSRLQNHLRHHKEVRLRDSIISFLFHQISSNSIVPEKRFQIGVLHSKPIRINFDYANRRAPNMKTSLSNNLCCQIYCLCWIWFCSLNLGFKLFNICLHCFIWACKVSPFISLDGFAINAD